MFPSGHPSKYWLGSTLLNFSDRTRTGVFSVIWPLASVRVTLKVFQLHVFTPREQIKKAEHQRLLKERSQKCSAFLLKRSRLVFKRVVAFLTPSQWSLRLKSTALVGQWIPPWTWPNKKGRTPKTPQKREVRSALPFSKASPFWGRLVKLTRQIIQSKGLSLNRSQYGSCSTKYDTPAGS